MKLRGGLRLDLDFAPRRRARWPAWALLGLGALLAADMGRSFLDARTELAGFEPTSVSGARDGRRVRGPSTREQRIEGGEQEMAEARRVGRQLALPWKDLFQAVEQANGEKIALIAIQPDPERNAVNLAGEAASYPEVLNYVMRLREQEALGEAYLVSHEVRAEDPQRPVSFVVAVKWRTL